MRKALSLFSEHLRFVSTLVGVATFTMAACADVFSRCFSLGQKRPAAAVEPYRLQPGATSSVPYLLETRHLHGELWKSGEEVAGEAELLQLLQPHHRDGKLGQAIDVQPSVSRGTPNQFKTC